MIPVNTPRFPLGRVVATPGAVEALQRAGQSPWELVARHVHGDWGELDEHDRQVNEDAMKTGARILSVFTLATGVKLWVITEADRRSTCVLTPDEY